MRNLFSNSILDINDYITIKTYQAIENEVKEDISGFYISRMQSHLAYGDEYKIVVYDECHYFNSDSNFNTNTCLSYDYLMNAFCVSIQVFMSATMDKMQNYFRGYKRESVYSSVYSYPKRLNSMIEGDRKDYIITIEKDYSYVELVAFNYLEDIKEDIIESAIHQGQKWLIFVDDIKRGENFKKCLIREEGDNKNKSKKSEEGIELLDAKDVVFITAGYAKDEEALESVQQITEKNLTNKKVVIATPVIDNGISLHDPELTNIVIMADTEEEFIQMLGRKRDEGNIKVYISRRSQAYFKKRKQGADRVAGFYKRHKEGFEGLSSYFHNFITMGYETFQHPSGCQRNLMDEILDRPSSYRCAQSICFSIGGLLQYNLFSYYRICNLQNFYQKMIKEMETDENAFLVVQAEWLGKDKESIEEYILILRIMYSIKNVQLWRLSLLR